MDSTIAAMLIVFCTNEFSTCELLDSKIATYTNVNSCNEKLLPALQSVTSKGEQIFGKCVVLEPSLFKKYYAVYWNVNHEGHFIIDILNDRTERFNGSPVPLNRISMPPI